MLTLRDCIDFCDLTEDEIDAIAEHEHVPEIIAVEIAQYLAHLPKGPNAIRRFIRDDIRDSEARCDRLHAAKLAVILRWFEHECANGRFQ
jgi:hypothetical protein